MAPRSLKTLSLPSPSDNISWTFLFLLNQYPPLLALPVRDYTISLPCFPFLALSCPLALSRPWQFLLHCATVTATLRGPCIFSCLYVKCSKAFDVSFNWYQGLRGRETSPFNQWFLAQLWGHYAPGTRQPKHWLREWEGRYTLTASWVL